MRCMKGVARVETSISSPILRWPFQEFPQNLASTGSVLKLALPKRERNGCDPDSKARIVVLVMVPRWQCPRCEKVLSSKTILINHVVKGSVCHSSKADAQTVRQFIEDLTRPAKPRCHPCRYCPKAYANIGHRSRHEKGCPLKKSQKVPMTVVVGVVPHGQEDFSGVITSEWLKALRPKFVNKAILEAFKDIHFNQDRPEYMNVYISNLKDKVCRVFSSMGIWMRADMENTVESAYEKVVGAIQAVLDSLEDPNTLSEFNDRWGSFLERDRAVEYVKQDIRMLMADLKDTVKKMHRIGMWARATV